MGLAPALDEHDASHTATHAHTHTERHTNTNTYTHTATASVLFTHTCVAERGGKGKHSEGDIHLLAQPALDQGV